VPPELANQLRKKVSARKIQLHERLDRGNYQRNRNRPVATDRTAPSFASEVFAGVSDDLSLKRSAVFLTHEEFNKDLAIEERLDGMIDKAVKRLAHLKGIKEVLFGAPAVEDASKSTSAVKKYTRVK
jgi:hypothetical protein